MMFTNAARALRFLRLRARLTQTALGGRVRLSRQTVSRLERGQLSGLTLGSLDRIAGAVGASVHVQVRWHGERLERLMDARHATIQQAVAALLARLGWDVRAEVSFNQYGDRGRIDLLARHARTGVVLVVEVKSALGDLQETLGRLDVKTRLAARVARDVGWTDVTAIVPALVIGDSRLARRTITAHKQLFARYGIRGRRAVAWLRHPAGPMPTGLLWFVNRPDSHHAVTAPRRRPSDGPDSR